MPQLPYLSPWLVAVMALSPALQGGGWDGTGATGGCLRAGRGGDKMGEGGGGTDHFNEEMVLFLVHLTLKNISF